jgi:hypothetical protein
MIHPQLTMATARDDDDGRPGGFVPGWEVRGEGGSVDF